jgi:hypothetical protein
MGIFSLLVGLATANAQPKKAEPAAKLAAAEAAKPAAPAAMAGAKPAEAAPAAAAMPITAPKPPVELDALKWALGSWRCKGEMFMPPAMGGNHPYDSSMVSKLDLNKFWVTTLYKVKPSKAMPGMSVSSYMGYDVASKKYAFIGFDTWGGWFSLSSTGATNDQWVWTGDSVMMGQKMPTRFTFTNKSDKEMTALMETSMAKGQWTKMSEETCKK